MGITIKATFDTRRDAEMAVERLVQEYSVERTDIFIAPEGCENTAGDVPAGSDTEGGDPSVEDRDDAPLGSSIAVSVDLENEDKAVDVRSALEEFGGENVVVD